MLYGNFIEILMKAVGAFKELKVRDEDAAIKVATSAGLTGTPAQMKVVALQIMKIATGNDGLMIDEKKLAFRALVPMGKPVKNTIRKNVKKSVFPRLVA